MHWLTEKIYYCHLKENIVYFVTWQMGDVYLLIYPHRSLREITILFFFLSFAVKYDGLIWVQYDTSADTFCTLAHLGKHIG